MKLNYNGDRLDDEDVREIVVTDDIFLVKDACGNPWLNIFGDEHCLTKDEAEKLSQALSLGVSVGFFNKEED